MYRVIVYYPYYSQIPPKKEYKIYNENGEQMHTFFLRSNLSYNDTQSRYFIWDRWNYNLDVHFYMHDAVYETMGNPQKKYAMFYEPYSLVPSGYEIFKKNKGIEKDFDLIFTHYTEFLEKYDNARFYNPFAYTWGVLKDKNGKMPDDIMSFKTKKISMLSSDLLMCDLHKLRYELANKCKRLNLADTYGTFDGGRYVNFSETVLNYKYSIVIENYLDEYWFTEKILNCFAYMCIPIYLGASKIDKFFNPDGIIKISINDLDNIENILKQCTEENYLSRLDAVKENYYKSLQYQYTLDILYKKYIEPDLTKDKIILNTYDYVRNEVSTLNKSQR